MTDKDIVSLVHNSMYHQLIKNNMATPVQVLIDLKVLSEADIEKWRFGKVDYLEIICKINLNKISKIMREVRVYAKKNDLKPSFTYYKQYGLKNTNNKLRFSKSGKDEIEKAYATHYLRKPKVKND